MSTLLASTSIGSGDETLRAQKLANAKKRLKSFRANRSTDTLASASSSISALSDDSNGPIPLVTNMSSNTPMTPTRVSRQAKENDYSFDLPPIPLDLSASSRSQTKLRKKRSKGSMSHRRQASSLHLGGDGGSTKGLLELFDSDELEVKAPRGLTPRFNIGEVNLSDIIATPVVADSTDASAPSAEEDPETVKSRLTTFTFGAKAPQHTRSPSMRNRRPGQPLLPSQLLPCDAFPSPSSSPAKRLSTPHSRPPSLVLTRPTPHALESPSPAGIEPIALQPPQTPPTPARTKRHSHTRSESISLPNLKFGPRPTSLGIPTSPSFPSSPSSSASRTTPVITGRLKFEPSGRGAEAEMEKDEHRRKALERLTGSPSPTFPDSAGHEIALPDLDDEDTSSVASSGRPFSGTEPFNFGRPLSSSSTPSASSWPISEDSPPLSEWSTGLGKTVDSDDALGFGFTFSGNGSGSFSFGAISPPSTVASVENAIGMGLPSTMASRPPLTRNLSVLAEVDEPEDGEGEQEESSSARTHDSSGDILTLPTEIEGSLDFSHDPLVKTYPGPSRLRELHLASAVSSNTGSPRASNPPSNTSSPTKGYGAIGRGRPAPTKHAKKDSPFSFGSAISTPGKASGSRRRPEPVPGSRASSISYKRDSDTTSSREWSISSKGPFSPMSSLGDVASSPSTFSPQHSGWGAMARPSPAGRPCPRPKSLAGMSHDNQGAGRVLGELEEVNEDGLSSRNTSARFPSGAMSDRHTSDHSRNPSGMIQWRDPQVELEIARDRLLEDVDTWKWRYSALEEKLELERKENAGLRERARKLGDRLSSISSYPATSRDTSLIADLRSQLFGVKGDLERERTERQSAEERVSELEDQLRALQCQLDHSQQTVSSANWPTASGGNILPETSPAISDTLRPSPDPISRMRAWGFPRGTVQPNSTRNNRESFFGLSQVLRRDSAEPEEPETYGVDLPPISLPALPCTEIDVPLRAVSDPTPVVSPTLVANAVEPDHSVRSVSLKSSASNALSMLTEYLPKLPQSNSQPLDQATNSAEKERAQRLPTSQHLGNVDFSRACRCCVGEVLQV